tara:strand:- start:31815 stop:32960 length:1146 start_codon:yes stop_codon:yes gene_type:complete
LKIGVINLKNILMSFLKISNTFLFKWFASIDKMILFLLITWITLGVIFNSNSILGFASSKLYNDSKILVNKFYLFIFLGSLVIFFSSLFNENFYKQSGKIFFLISFFLLFLTLIIGVEVKGSKRWLNFIFLNFQPVELLKPSLIIYLSSIFSSNIKLSYKFLLSGFISFICVLILLLQPDYTQSLIILVIWFTLIFMSGVNLAILFSFFFILAGFMTSVLIIFKKKFSYVISRFEKWINVNDISYQSEKSLDAIQHGGFFGQGIGEGILKEKIPESHTDYVLASISEEYGIIIIILILIIVFSLFMRVFAICQKEISNFKKYTLVTLSTIILLQIFINIGVTINLLPSTGMTFAFISYGGSSIITSSFIMGIILALTKIKN